jgi:hypothetical protein
MIAKPHRMNSDFQLRYFIAGSCHTPDAAWLALYAQMLDAEEKVISTEAQQIRRGISKRKALTTLENEFSKELDKLEAQAQLIELKASEKIFEMNVLGVKKELEAIKNMMAELEPLRKYGHLDVLEATEAMQREEWLLELKSRTEDYLVTSGTIPHDHMNALKMHPDFKELLTPYILEMNVKLQTCVGADAIYLIKHNDNRKESIEVMP